MGTLLAASSILVLSTGGVNGGELADRPEPAEEIIVTGERMPRTLRQTASSVVPMTQDMVDATAADRLDQLLAMVPNVQLGSGEEGPAIRGQDSTGLLRNLFAFLGGTRPRVTLQVDGRPVSYYEHVSSSAPVWDIERIEIFRSPQTTTQGRNSIAGAIFIETNDPAYEWQGRTRMLVGEAHTGQGSAMLSGPIVADQIAFRFSGDVRFSQTASDMADGIAGADIDSDDFGLARVKFLVEPSALPGVRLETNYTHLQSQAPQFEAVRAPFQLRQTITLERTNGINKVNTDTLTARMSFQSAKAFSSTVTLSYGDALVRRFGLPGLGQTRVKSEDYSIEAIARWQPDTAITLVSGLHHLGMQQHQTINITGLGLGQGEFRDRQHSLGLFGEVTYRPLAPLAITAGLRYQRDRQDRNGGSGTGAAGIRIDYDKTFEAWLPKLSVSYDFADSLTAGFLVQRAFHPGGTSLNLRRRAQDNFDAESLWNYEAFLRSSHADGRVTLAANLFYNDIDDAQRQQLVPVPLADGSIFQNLEFANAPAARSYGAEMELGWNIGSALSLKAGLGLLRTKITRTVLPADGSLGKEFQRAPHLSLAGALDWRPADPLRLSLQVRHHSGYFSDDANDPTKRIGSATVLDIRSSFSFGVVTVFGYARNAFDKFYLTYLFDRALGAAGDPRELGIGVEARF